MSTSIVAQPPSTAANGRVPERPVEHLDVLIVGAGLSGVGAACHLRAKQPDKTFAILEARDGIGGTWDLFRYPGIRSDSDMFTLGYSFRPWEDAKAIADGPSILRYVRETARDHDVESEIRFHHRVVRAEWSTAQARWTVDAERTDTGEAVRLTCGFLFICTGYYRYDEGFTPHFEGTEDFSGRIVHPQHWPADLDYAGKRVVVIGSGATAVTLVPAMAEQAAHVTMLQRSPSYVVSLPARDPVADVLRRALPAKVAYPIVRWKNVLLTTVFFHLSRRAPRMIKALIRKGVERRLPRDYDVDTHFKPRYDPWDQRVCLVPDGDLFQAIHKGQASVVTDRVETFTEKGLKLASGRRARSRRDRHRHRAERPDAGRHEDRGRRPGARSPQGGELQGHDVRRRAEPGVCTRLHQRLVDAQVRPRRRARLQAAGPHGRARLRPMHAE